MKFSDIDLLTESAEALDRENTQKCNAKIKYYSPDNCLLTASTRNIYATAKAPQTEKHKDFKRRQEQAFAEAELHGHISGTAPKAEPTEAEKAKNKHDSLLRAKKKVFDIAYANGDDWRYMVTLTLDGSKIDRESADTVLTPFQNWLKNCVKRKGLKALIVPEYHKNGAIHFHGLFNGALKTQFSGTVKASGYKKPIKVATAKRYGLKPEEMTAVFNSSDWKYGFSTFVPLDNNLDKICGYVTKYITKDLDKIFGKYYFAVGDLKREVPTEYYFLSPSVLQNIGEAFEDLKINTAKLPNELGEMYYYKANAEAVRKVATFCAVESEDL